MEDDIRRAARVLVVDDDARVLLLRVRESDPPRAYWLTPGGGLDPGETAAGAAARELAEETGLRVPAAALGAPVHRETIRYRGAGRDVVQDQEFFVLRTTAFAVDTRADPGGLGAAERRTVDGHRWWTRAALADTAETVYPAVLPDLLDRVLAESAC
ncbi:DNA mismatch repair protein MutT [Pilimelia terevasa]|uniref:DNA mismatch repair protein MutT n=1 Tax=Pilimelia terevasa TaxID=53372 RepID=A0A8J3FKF5_9ACTN|nr:NUDIX domain-containing protein [Pilimelia terevasa]GGK28032.1 DNA mismatch repair protein MutT [Pilimelia terevasa]